MDVILITGIPGAGKSTVAKKLAEKLSRSVVISGDDMRELVIGGFTSPAEAWTEEHEMQYYLSFENEADVARNFIAKGFTVIIEDVVHTRLLPVWYSYFEGIQYEKIFLAPSKEVILERNRTREKKLPEDIITSLYSFFQKENFPGWIVLDTSNMTIDETVENLMRCLSEGNKQ